MGSPLQPLVLRLECITLARYISGKSSLTRLFCFRTALLAIVDTILCLCICGCGLSSYTYLVSTDRIEKDRTRLSVVEKVVGKMSPTGRVTAGGVDVLVQPSNAIQISQQRKGILFVFNSVHKINGTVGALGPGAAVGVVVKHARHTLLGQHAQVFDGGDDGHERLS